ncbi:beta-propeller fold lactonase family protein [Actinomycetes bacterium KLBMP 9797]
MRSIVAGLLAMGLVGAALVAPERAGAAVAAGDQVYVTNSALRADAKLATVARFAVSLTGTVQPAGTVKTGHGARGIVFTPGDVVGQQFAYVPSQLVDQIGRYRVAANGALTLLGATGTPQPFGIATSPDARTVYVSHLTVGTGEGGLSAFRVATDGDLVPLNAVTTGHVNAKGVAVTPDGRFVYVAHGVPNGTAPSRLVGFAVAADGSIGAQVVAVDIGASGHRVVITPDGRFLYVTNQEAGATGDIYGFKIGPAGGLIPVSPKPFEAGVWTEGAALSRDGKRLYTTALGVVGPVSAPVADGEVRGFAVNIDGTLTGIESLALGFDPVDLAVGPDGKALYVADFSGSSLTVLTIDATGGLKPVQTVSSEGANPGFQGVAVRPAPIGP